MQNKRSRKAKYALGGLDRTDLRWAKKLTPETTHACSGGDRNRVCVM